MAAEEIVMSMRVAEDQLETAKRRLDGKEFSDCVYHAASATENAANALVMFLGGQIPRGHQDADAIKTAVSIRAPELLEREEFKQMLEKVHELEHHVVKSRYPIKIREGILIPPHEYYKEKDAQQMFEDAHFVVDVIKRLIAPVLKS